MQAIGNHAAFTFLVGSLVFLGSYIGHQTIMKFPERNLVEKAMLRYAVLTLKLSLLRNCKLRLETTIIPHVSGQLEPLGFHILHSKVFLQLIIPVTHSQSLRTHKKTQLA